jgi:hypothetical protein
MDLIYIIDFIHALYCTFPRRLDSFMFVLCWSPLSAKRCYGRFDFFSRAVTSILLEEIIHLLTSNLLDAVRKCSRAYS